jgi:hypothetical protein
MQELLGLTQPVTRYAPNSGGDATQTPHPDDDMTGSGPPVLQLRCLRWAPGDQHRALTLDRSNSQLAASGATTANDGAVGDQQ